MSISSIAQRNDRVK